MILAAGLIALGAAATDLAASQTALRGADDDLSAAFATSQDIAEGKRLADEACARCHGANGISTVRDVPHLAGQRAVYMHLELRAYKSGARGTGMMADAARFLSDDALIKAAAWYATLDPPQPVPAATTRAADSTPGPVVDGRGAAAGCAGCHGEAGISSTPGMPSLAGMNAEYLAAAADAYRSGRRKHDVMKAFMTGLGDADIRGIAQFYAGQKPGRARTPATGDAAAGKAASAACAACHGEAGAGTGAAPGLAGQDARYLVAATRAYRDGARSDPMMNGPAAAVTDAALADLAAYYASQTPQPRGPAKPATAAAWAQRCDRCHGFNGNSTDPRVPALAAQRADYLERTLNAYRSGTRKSTAMSAMAAILTEADIAGLAAHYSAQKARAVVYVRLPAKD